MDANRTRLDMVTVGEIVIVRTGKKGTGLLYMVTLIKPARNVSPNGVIRCINHEIDE